MSGACSTTVTAKGLDRIDTPIDGLGCCLWPLRPRVAAHRSGWSSCLAVRTGPLRRSPAVHARPIDLVVFQEPSH